MMIDDDLADKHCAEQHALAAKQFREQCALAYKQQVERKSLLPMSMLDFRNPYDDLVDPVRIEHPDGSVTYTEFS